MALAQRNPSGIYQASRATYNLLVAEKNYIFQRVIC
jgi:hypothetical protein